MFDDAGEAALADVAKDCIFAGKISEEGGLADLENVDNIVDARVLVTLFAEQFDSGLDNLLAQSRLFAFAKPKCLARVATDSFRLLNLSRFCALPRDLAAFAGVIMSASPESTRWRDVTPRDGLSI